MMLVPDELAPKCMRVTSGFMTPGKYLAFSHGFSIHYGFIKPPEDVSVFMVAPKGPGHLVRREYEKGAGVPCLSRSIRILPAKPNKLGWPTHRPSEGVVLVLSKPVFAKKPKPTCLVNRRCFAAGLTSLIKAGFETLVEAGYAPEMAYFECLHEMKLIVDLIYEGGISEMRYSISNTAQYGDMTRGPSVVNDETKRRMKGILAEVQSGAFAHEWMKESRNGRKRFTSSQMRRKNIKSSVSAPSCAE